MGDSLNEIFSERLKMAREELGWSQRDLSKKSGVSQATISRHEIRLRPVTNIENIVCLAGALAVSVDYLLGLTDDK